MLQLIGIIFIKVKESVFLIFFSEGKLICWNHHMWIWQHQNVFWQQVDYGVRRSLSSFLTAVRLRTNHRQREIAYLIMKRCQKQLARL